MSAGAPSSLHLFDAYGIEAEYMLVDASSLAVASLSERFLCDETGAPSQTLAAPPLEWSNELALHVVELKNPAPAPALDVLHAEWNTALSDALARMAPLGLTLMPTATHPWMEASEFRLWQHGDRSIYDAYDRIFDCRQPGFANLQSVHINLPFTGDDELARLHAAIRVILPLIPALAASSPYQNAAFSGQLDARLVSYGKNSAHIPAIAGRIIPEPIASRLEYETRILQPMYDAVAPFDPAGLLQYEWLNSRGAIARFDRNAIEIRLMDSQECPAMDFACVGLIVAVLRKLTDETLSSWETQNALGTEMLAAVLAQTTQQADEALIEAPALLQALGLTPAPRSALDIWRELKNTTGFSGGPVLERSCDLLLERGPLARRMLRFAGTTPSMHQLQELARTLCQCLARDEPFLL